MPSSSGLRPWLPAMELYALLWPGPTGTPARTSLPSCSR
jgi:hypothetical protein